MKIDLSRYLDGKATIIMRVFIVVMIFLSLVNLQGMQNMRQAHQIIFMLCVISLFSLILKNIWITLFLLWTVFLYSFFKFTSGNIYLSYIFFGCVYYLITKVAFKKEHINFFITGFLWFVCANIFYMAIQISGYDFMYAKIHYPSGIKADLVLIPNTYPRGFMGHLFTLSTILALAIPMLATRNSKWAMIGAFGLFVPLWIAKTSLCFIMGAVGMLFVLYFKIPKRAFIGLIVISIMAGVFYVKKIDRLGTERLVMWHKTMSDVIIHPITGWGLDSFANVTPNKDFRYAKEIKNMKHHKDVHGRVHWNLTNISWWDNPHNLIISLFYEFGVVGVVLFIGLMRQYSLRFFKSLKEPNVLALGGFILVFLGVSIGHFPIFLGRMAVFIIPAFALFEICTE